MQCLRTVQCVVLTKYPCSMHDMGISRQVGMSMIINGGASISNQHGNVQECLCSDQKRNGYIYSLHLFINNKMSSVSISVILSMEH